MAENFGVIGTSALRHEYIIFCQRLKFGAQPHTGYLERIAGTSKTILAAFTGWETALQNKTQTQTRLLATFSVVMAGKRESNNENGRCLTSRSDFRASGGQKSPFFIRKKAGNGNRTRMASLEGWNFTIKLCPHRTLNNEQCQATRD
jgi:hypothetical protein